ncbi:MAG: hypothetical protein HKP61_22040 [Dactylosporangium sp.]|nr:trehalose-6-phosphate synthase [Dactylosporangium sp.]NNJ63559.1 hypothetical protein [Dactylosporangium sp.]
MRLGAFGAAADVATIDSLARTAAAGDAADRVRALLGQPRTLLLSVERLDHTRGAEQRLLALAELLVNGRLDPRETAVVQVLPAIRQHVAGYRTLRRRVAGLIERINAALDLRVIHHIERSPSMAELVELYLAADVLAVTPLRDGGNLVAKEFVAARVDNGGALVLSEFAGAAAELGSAYLVDPFDRDALRDTIERAAMAAPAERRARMRQLRAGLRRRGVRAGGRRLLTTFAGCANCAGCRPGSA